MIKSVSPETYKLLKDECIMFAGRMNWFKDNTEISNDTDIFRFIALIASLCDSVSNKINE